MEHKKLSDSSLALVLAYAPAGLGHLRVTDALRHGLPEDTQAVLLPTREESIRILHGITSLNPLLRRLMEWSQYGNPQAIVTRIYRKILLSDAHLMEQQLFEILKQRVELPQTLLVVATHFGIAHQVGAIKHQLEKRAGVKVVLVVQVTDDSPQSIWFVPGADLITVPSVLTKDILLSYGKSHHADSVKIEVLPYPLSPHLLVQLSEKELRHRELQWQEGSDVPINIVIPISGASVGTAFSSALMKQLRHFSKQFHFHLVVKRNVLTDMFVQSMQRKEYVQTSSSHSDRQIIELYENVYDQTVAGFEVTKPSEQAFKALLSSSKRGGVILLFSTPVGRQEYDNLAFLRRHRLIPTAEEQQALFHFLENKGDISPQELLRIFPKLHQWRGICIPDDAKKAANVIWKCIERGVFHSMHGPFVCEQDDVACEQEVNESGVVQFWEHVEKLL